MRNLEADVLHWQEKYQQSLRKAHSPSRANLPVSRASSHSGPLTDVLPSSPDHSRGVVIAADENPPAEHDDLDGLIGCDLCAGYFNFLAFLQMFEEVMTILALQLCTCALSRKLAHP